VALLSSPSRVPGSAYGSPGQETSLGYFSPDWSGNVIEILPTFLMQWLRPEIVLAGIEEAQSARFEFGETRNVVPLPLTQSPKMLAKSSGADLPF
jgi:hypothetical protein